jgi:A-macroglobulin complement component/TonB-dependent receptor-like protein/MG2 domain-containing protein/alpha-2-macroglobulin family protein/A-macroglobulin receptor
MKKRHYLILSTALLLTASSIYQINTHPIIESLMKELSSKSEILKEELVYLHLDRSFYRPGETIWFNGYIRDANERKAEGVSEILNIEFYKPNGTLLDSFKIVCLQGQGNGSLQLPHDKGGVYKIKAFTDWQKNSDSFFEKEIQVQNILLPNLNMTLEFEKKAYGANDQVIADLTLESLDNEVIRFTSFKYKVNLFGKEYLSKEGKTDFEGKAKIEFILPDSLKSNDGILNVMIPYRGLTESISRSVPIILNNIDLAFFPEGGDIIDRHSSFIAFEALNEFGKPADIDGVIENAEGEVITNFSSLHNGMGKFALTTESNETYFAKITKPEGITQRYKLPQSKVNGTTLNILDHQKDYLKVGIQHTEEEMLHLVAQAGDAIYFSRSFVPSDLGQLKIPTEDFPIGIARLTVFNNKKEAQCERLVFLNKHKKLNIEVITDKEVYLPREKVEVSLKVTDENGQGVIGDFSISASDDKLLTYADDKQGHVLSKVLLESELKGDIHEPNFYFDDEEEDADVALDLLLMTHGWRRFEWQQVFDKREELAMFPKEQCIVAGMVTDSLGQGIPNVVVSRRNFGHIDTTDALGRFEFRNILFNYYGEVFTATLGQKVVGRKMINNYGTEFNIPIVNRTGDLSGYIFDQHDDLCTSCNFQISNEKENIKWDYTADKRGAFSILNLEAGAYKINLLNQDRKVLFSDTVTIIPLQEVHRNFYFNRERKLQELANKIKKDSIKELENSWLTTTEMSKLPPPDFEKSTALNNPIDKTSTEENSMDLDSRSMTSGGIELSSVVVTGYKVPLIEQDNTTQGGTLTSDQIRNLPTKNISSLAAVTAGLSQQDEGDAITVKGSRANATDYYIDGIRVSGSGMLIPASEIDQIQVITGGIEAKYGGGEAVMPPRKRVRGKLPPNPNLEYAEGPENEGFAFDALNISGSRSGYVGRTSPRYYKPKKVYALPSIPAIYQPKCKECLEVKEERKKRNCHSAQLIEEVKKYTERYFYSHRIAQGKSANIQFVVDKNGLIGDFKVIPDNQADAGFVRIFYSLPYYIRNWTPARNKGKRAASIYNIRVDYKDLAIRKVTPYRQQRRFYYRNYYHNYKSKIRNDFRSTTYWNPAVKTDVNGEAKLYFWNSDDITKVNISVEGFGKNGTVGRGEGSYVVNTPFSIISKTPSNVATLDTMQLPLTLINNTDEKLEGKLNVIAPPFCKMITDISMEYKFKAKESKTIFLTFAIIDTSHNRWNNFVEISFETKDYFDAYKKRVQLIQRGYPHHYTFTDIKLQNDFELNITDEYPGSISTNFKAHPSPFSEVASAMEKIIRQPGGCFEQTSSSNYPNLMVLQLMQKTGSGNAKIRERAIGFLEKGYKRLTGFESRKGGFSLFGRSASDPGLSAMGLLQFMDMSKVYQVDQNLIDRTANWLMSDQDKNGGWKGEGCYYYQKTIQRDAYILWAMSEAGYSDKLEKEMDRQYDLILKKNDPYLMALLCNALFLANDSRAEVLVEKLIHMQKSNGGWAGAERSVSYSKGKNLEIETTALAFLALAKSVQSRPAIEQNALNYLLKSRNQYGYGSTQSTVLTLKAIIASMSRNSGEATSDGVIELLVNGQAVKEFFYKKDQNQGILFDQIPGIDTSGKYAITIQFKETKKPIPFELEVSYYSKTGQSNKLDCSIALTTEWNKAVASVGETIRLTSTIENLTKDTVATPLAIIGIPGGLTAQPWQLKELQDERVVEYYEVEQDRVVFYLNHMTPEESKIINLDLKAELPGTYQSPASQAYLYYDNDAVSWAVAKEVIISN